MYRISPLCQYDGDLNSGATPKRDGAIDSGGNDGSFISRESGGNLCDCGLHAADVRGTNDHRLRFFEGRLRRPRLEGGGGVGRVPVSGRGCQETRSGGPVRGQQARRLVVQDLQGS